MYPIDHTKRYSVIAIKPGTVNVLIQYNDVQIVSIEPKCVIIKDKDGEEHFFTDYYRVIIQEKSEQSE